MNRIDRVRPDLNLLFVFQALLSERHVGRAAARLGLTQSAVSHALGRLRMMFDDRLFIRTAKGVEPTSRALVLAPKLIEILDRVNAVFADPGRFDYTRPRSFTIAMIDNSVHSILVPLTSRLRTVAPAIDLRITRLDRRRVIAAFDLQEIDFALMNDFALSNFLDTPSRITRTPIIADRFVGIARQGHPGLAKKPLTPTAYAALPHLLISVLGDAVGFVDPLLAQLGLKRRVVMTVPYAMAAPHIIAGSDLVTLIPERIARRYARELGLIFFEPPLAIPGFTIDLLMSVARLGDPALMWLRDQVLQTCREEQPIPSEQVEIAKARNRLRSRRPTRRALSRERFSGAS